MNYAIEFLSGGVWHRAQSAGSMPVAMYYADQLSERYDAVRITQGGAVVYCI